ncbi:MAG: F0F1 ATP synthase subunit gamma [Campylobacteraceae bacterium]|jgi:F-type H+-transporting ATPase subunit gamma|nr:F0F1 ATP synthase subunit gamma [Campylobacteraceae bacterium]
MSNLKEIKRKIKSVQNTQKTTRAMKLVSTAKLRKAEEVARQSRVYANKINEMLSEISYKLSQYKAGDVDSKFFKLNDTPKIVDIIFITADKGLCGGFNIQTIKSVKRLMEEFKNTNVKVRLRAVGRKGIDYFTFKDTELLKRYVGVSSSPNYEKSKEIISDAVKDFMENLTDKIILVHNGYLNMISQQLKIVDVLPIEAPSSEQVQTHSESKSLLEIEAESEKQIVEELMKKYLEYNMYYALIDSLAAEHSARMQAMENATNNARDRVHHLTIAYNKARQESITTELIEIISGMESMK